MSTLKPMRTELRNLNHLTAGIAVAGFVLLMASGCAMQDKFTSSRDNSAFQNLVQDQYSKSHWVAKASHLVALTGDQEKSVQAKQEIVAAEIAAEIAAEPPKFRAQSPDQPYQASQIPASGSGGGVQQTQYQYPENATGAFGLPSPGTGIAGIDPNSIPLGTNFADIDVFVGETQTGSINVGGAYNSDNGIVGQFVIDERNFDIRAWPRSFQDILDGTAWRGGGQAFRLELVPGRNVQRYLVSFSEPYLFGTDYSFSLSGYLFDRRFFDWDEQRVGGRVSFGRRLTPDLSINFGLRLENVEIDNPRVTTSQQLNESLGDSDLFLFNIGLTRDTRDHPFLATEGTLFTATYTQGFGDFDYPRGDIEYRRYRLLYERPDGSGRHTLTYGTKLGFSGSSTPIFENYFAGGFSSLRGYEFRGAAPVENGVRVGGEFQWLNTVEYVFPITPDDMVKGVVFCDFGTVEENIELSGDNFRVAPGVGLRVHVPALGIGAPLAFDFAFPVNSAEGDDEKVFSFYLGLVQ